jgi:tubulin polyglutamylase TTLL4
MKSTMFKDLNEVQKINHFPGTFNIGRKDRLWKNYHKLRLKFGKEEFSFLPRTFCLPADTKLLRKVWEKRGVKAKWIIKPPAVSLTNSLSAITFGVMCFYTGLL